MAQAVHKWPCLHIMLLDAAVFTTIKSIFQQVQLIRASAPPDATVVTWICYMHTTTEVKKMWTDVFTQRHRQDKNWHVLGLCAEGIAIVNLQGHTNQITVNKMSISDPPRPSDNVDYGAVLIYMEFQFSRDWSCDTHQRTIGITWTPDVTYEGPGSMYGASLSEHQLQGLLGILTSHVALFNKYGFGTNNDHYGPIDAPVDVLMALSDLRTQIDGFIAFTDTRDASNNPTSSHTWHASGKMHVSLGTFEDGSFIPISNTGMIQVAPACYKVKARKKRSTFPAYHGIEFFNPESPLYPRQHSGKTERADAEPEIAGFTLAVRPKTDCTKQNEVDQHEEESTCVICMETDSCFVMERCGHLVMCGKCRQRVCKQRHMKNRNIETLPRDLTMCNIQNITVDCLICRTPSKPVHRVNYSGPIFYC